MVTLEEVEKLREYANISYDEAKRALEEADGDILEAVIILEKQDLIQKPKNGGYHNSRNYEGDNYQEGNQEDRASGNKSTSFSVLINKIFKFLRELISKGNINHFEVIRGEKSVFVVPFTVLAIFLLFTFWITVPLLIIGLFLGYRYKFTGPNLGKENVNRAMDSVADAADNLKKEIKGEKPNGENSHN